VADELFKTAPEEVLRYFRAKKSVPTFDWRDIAPEEHAYSWTVAKSMEGDVLEDIRAAVDDAIANRVPFEEFQKNLTPILQQKGWWGRRIQEDPKDGVPKVVQLGSPRRLRTIYWANTRTAHAAGEWERTERNKRFLPFLVYTLSTAERRRLEHERYVGIVAPVDDPIWNRLYPPNGWGCQCGVRQISQREAERLGWRPDKEPVQLVERPWRNRRTGQTVMVPEGVDPGWDTNPGKNRGRNVAEFLHGKVTAMPANRQRVAIEDIVNSPAMTAMAMKRMPKSFLPVAQLPEAVVSAFGARSNLALLSDHSVDHILRDHPERALTVDELKAAIGVIAAPVAVSRKGAAALFIGFMSGRWWRVVTRSTGDGGEWWLESFHPKSEKDVRSFLRSQRRQGRLVIDQEE
jgi:hypothetical protein